MISLTRELEYEYLEQMSLTGKWLNLGAANINMDPLRDSEAEFVNADINSEKNPDVVMDATKEFFLDDASFDGILALNILEHLDNTEKFMGECFRVLKEGGCLLATIPFFYPYHGSDVCGDYNRWTWRKLEEEAGEYFQEVKVEQMGGRFGVLSELLFFTTPVFLRPLYGLVRPLVKWMDNSILLPSEIRGSKQYYLMNFLNAKKVNG